MSSSCAGWSPAPHPTRGQIPYRTRSREQNLARVEPPSPLEEATLARLAAAHGLPVQARRFADRRHNHPTIPNGQRRPAVLVECDDGAAAFARMQLLQAAGYRVSWCPGPDGHPVRRCPLIDGSECPLLAKADVMVSSLGLDHESARLVLRAADSSHPELAVVIETTDASAETWSSVVDSHRLVAAPGSAVDLVTAVTEALAAPGASRLHPDR